ncbi:MAG: diguanylate cyclase [Pseudomonadota bacterium]
MQSTTPQQDGRPHPGTWLALGAYGVILFLVIALSFQIGFASNAVVAVWPASGIGTCAALRYGWRALIPIVLSGVCYSLIFQPEGPIGLYAMTSAGNALAICCAIAAYRTLGGSTTPFSNVRAVLLVILVLAAGHSTLAAMAGAGLVGLSMGLPGTEIWSLWWRWFLSDFTGVVLVLPAAVALAPHVYHPARTVRRAFARHDRRVALLASSSVSVVLVAAASLFPGQSNAYPLVLLTMPLCTWLAFRADTTGSMVLLSLTITLALAQALMRPGTATGEVFLTLQLYGMVVMCTSLVIHAGACERRKAVRALAQERANLEATVASRTAELREQVLAHEQIKQELEILVKKDPLTGVANRRAFLERGEQEVSRHHRTNEALSLLMVDIDHFKRINDTYGHAVGDEVIVSVAKCLADTLRAGTDMVARIGGEEFACLLGNTDRSAALATAERLRAAVESLAIGKDRRTLRTTASFGACTLSRSRADLESLLLGADHALYAAKRAGRNRVYDLHGGTSATVELRANR